MHECRIPFTLQSGQTALQLALRGNKGLVVDFLVKAGCAYKGLKLPEVAAAGAVETAKRLVTEGLGVNVADGVGEGGRYS